MCGGTTLVKIDNSSQNNSVIIILIKFSNHRQYPDQYEFYFSTNEHYKKIVEKWIDNLNYIIYPAAFSEATSDDPKARVEYFAKFGELWKERDMVKFNKNGGHPYRSESHYM